jgi:large repetitive protein
MPSYSGVWTLTAQYQAIGGQNWPMGPGAPTSVSAEAGDTSATVTFVAPTFTGVPPGITQYRAIASPGGTTVTGASSPLTVTGLTNGTAYTISVDATNGVQYGPSGTSGSVTPSLQRALYHLGVNNIIGYINISSTGNAVDFGDLSANVYHIGALGSATRAVFGGGSIGGTGINTMEYVTFASLGNAADFGDLVIPRNYCSGLANSTRGVFGGGSNDSGVSNSSSMDYITIATTGNATNFGNLTVKGRKFRTCASPTRGIFAMGYSTQGDSNAENNYITIASTGNATYFGDLSGSAGQNNSSDYGAGCSSDTRGMINGPTNVMSYITIASTGNTVDFGDMVTSVRQGMGSASSNVRGLNMGGSNGSVDTNVIDYFTIATLGNAADFGDLLTAIAYGAACSNCSGGVQ